ncbi:MAG: LamG-like jellyroll fold domain-containing protein [Bryobacteraceae bacterium]
MASVVRRSLLAAAVAALVNAEVPGGLTFHASFETTDAAVARGDRGIYSAPSYKEQSKAVPGLAQAPRVSLAPGAGRNGSGALRFSAKNENAVFYRAADNVPFRPGNWTGTISFFLRLDPDKDLEPGYCDPIQVTDSAYNDSAIWVDFTRDDKPRHFRLGVFGELKSWNPNDVPADKNPAFLRRLTVVRRPPFAAGRWTHVLITHQGLGGGKGRATLYLDGRRMGFASGIGEVFEWNPDLAAIRLGVSYVGLMDDVMIFDRVLAEREILQLAR